MADVLDNVEVERISTQVEGAEEKDDFVITKNALDIIGQIREQNEIPEDFKLRIGTQEGGCSGVQYSLGFDSEVNENDLVLNANKNEIVVDNHSVFFIQGVTLDYVDGPSGSGFVFDNPNNTHNCGCQC